MELNLRHIHKLLQTIMKEHHHPIYQMHTLKTNKDSKFLKKTFEDPYFELFLWSIFSAKVDLVEYFWHKIQEPMVGAIIAGSIYSKLAKFYKDLNMSDQLSNFHLLYTYKKQFEDKVNKVKSICNNFDLVVYLKKHKGHGFSFNVFFLYFSVNVDVNVNV